MAGIDLSKELVFHEVGNGYLETVTGKVVDITYGQDMKFDVKATLTDVEGGASLFPIYTFISKKEGSITINSATFSLSQAGIGQAIAYTTSNILKNGRVIATLATSTLGASLTGVTNVVCLNSNGEKIVVSQTGTAATDGVDVSATGAILWGATVPAGEYKFFFRSVAATATMAGLLKNDMPEVASFSWTLTTEDLDGIKYQVDIFAKRVRADGSFTIDAKKNSATVPSLQLKILDPADGTDNFATITVSKVA